MPGTPCSGGRPPPRQATVLLSCLPSRSNASVRALSRSVLRSLMHGSHTSLPPTCAGAAFMIRSPHGVPVPTKFSDVLFLPPNTGIFGAQNEEGKVTRRQPCFPPRHGHTLLPPARLGRM